MTQLSLTAVRSRRGLVLSAIAAAMLATMAPLVHAPVVLDAPATGSLSA